MTRRLLVYLLVDCSSEMAGDAHEQVVRSIDQLLADLRSDPSALESIDISLLTFSETAQQVIEPTEVVSFQLPVLTADGDSRLGEGFRLLEECAAREVRTTTSDEKGDWKPFIFLFTNGRFADHWQGVVEEFKQRVPAKVIVTFVGSISNRPNLDESFETVINAADAQDWNLSSFFKWVCASVSSGAPEFRRILPAETENVRFTAFTSAKVQPGSSFVFDVWAHLDRQQANVLEVAARLGRSSLVGTKGPVQIEFGTILSVIVDLPGFDLDDRVDEIVWTGEAANASFIIYAPTSVRTGRNAGRVRVCIDGVPVTKLVFEVHVAEEASNEVSQLAVREERATTAFASYASQDRNAVLARIQGMQKSNPGLDVFLDVLSLRSGDNWEERIRSEIPSRDVFFLFWSRQAAASEWVEREWRLAMDSRGLSYIDPVPLEDPSTVPPPLELQSLHFNDYYLAFIKGAMALETLQREATPIDLIPPPPDEIDIVL